jgi:hypothetical protein
MKKLFYQQFILFIIMFLVGMTFNPMNMLAYNISDIYFSLTLFYSSLLMASNMIWSHQIVHYITMGHFNINIFFIGILLSILFVFLLRKQVFVNGCGWLKRMIGHHSTAITTTRELLKKRKNFQYGGQLYRLAQDIVFNQEKEMMAMRAMLI